MLSRRNHDPKPEHPAETRPVKFVSVEEGGKAQIIAKDLTIEELRELLQKLESDSIKELRDAVQKNDAD